MLNTEQTWITPDATGDYDYDRDMAFAQNELLRK